MTTIIPSLRLSTWDTRCGTKPSYTIAMRQCTAAAIVILLLFSLVLTWLGWLRAGGGVVSGSHRADGERDEQ